MKNRPFVTDNCKDCVSNCEHAGKDREFICIGGVSCKKTVICEHIVGFFCTYEEQKLVTFKELKEIIAEDKKNGFNSTISDYAEKGEYHCFERFDYCPKCGAEFDWEKIKKWRI